MDEKETRKTELVKQYGEVLNTAELQEKYEVSGFGYGMVFVKDKATGKKGAMDFDHMPRFYYNFQAV
ncbi:unnamed protein product [marine sediment metagenome]|uniref:Uncharacterized protein n=1 Tax=marine sediment metagenome TaxID=412755 RepID=X0RQR0_9ZZZZ